MSYPFKRFSQLKAADLNVELQTHTTWTDGKASLGDLLTRAAERGLATIAVTEHVRRDTDWFPQFAAAVRQEATRFKDLQILVGCEAKALDEEGGLDTTAAIRAECDLVLGVVHRMTLPSGEGFYNPADFEAGDFQDLELRHILGLIKEAPIDVVGHPMGMSLRHFANFPERQFRSLIEACKESKVAVEINSSYLGDRLPDFVKLCRELDPWVSIGSDAHNLDEVGLCRDRLTALGVG